MITLYDLVNMYDNWNGNLVINDKNLAVVIRTKLSDLEKNYEIYRPSLWFAEVEAFGFYDDELCVRVNYTEADEKKMRCRVQAWSKDLVYLGNIDIADLKSGMLIKEVGGLVTVEAPAYDDGEDYMIPIRKFNDEVTHCSALCFE